MNVSRDLVLLRDAITHIFSLRCHCMVCEKTKSLSLSEEIEED
jgi:hypothetical protein